MAATIAKTAADSAELRPLCAVKLDVSEGVPRLDTGEADVAPMTCNKRKSWKTRGSPPDTFTVVPYRDEIYAAL